MNRKHLPSLPDTGRRYVEHTRRARLGSPGVEHYPRRRGRAGRVLIAVAVVAAVNNLGTAVKGNYTSVQTALK